MGTILFFILQKIKSEAPTKHQYLAHFTLCSHRSVRLLNFVQKSPFRNEGVRGYAEERNDDKKGLSELLSPFGLCQSQAVFKVTSVGRG